MYRRTPEIEIDAADPFKHDLLEREPIARNLTELLRRTTPPYVLGVSAPWGMGKTTFVRMWAAHLRSEKFGVGMFNA